MKITDVIELYEVEQAFGTPGSKAMGAANFALLSRYYTQPARRTSATLNLNFGNGRLVSLDNDDVEAIAKYYDTLPHDSERYDFVYDTMSRADKFNTMLYKIGRRTQEPPASPLNDPENQMALDLKERDLKKNSELGINRDTVRSPELTTALKRAYAQYPNATSDMEALIMHDMDVQKSTGKELRTQSKINQRQDDIDAQMRDVARKQSNKISSLDQENDDLTAELDRLSRELDAMHGQTGTEPERKKDDDQPTSDKQGSVQDLNYDVTVNTKADGRGEKKQQRSAGAEKRQTEPARLRPGATTLKPVGTTLPMIKPAKPPLPTIDVIDKPEQPTASPALGQMVRHISQRAPAPELGKPSTVEPDVDTTASADNVFQFPSRLSRPEPEVMDQPDLFDNPLRTGTHNESRELRRMRELAGLPQ
jgi:hypothetical protein